MIKADVLYIGYPRCGSTFLRKYFRDHPQIMMDDQQIAEILYQPKYEPILIDKPYTGPRGVYISCDESICEGVCITGNPAVWSKHLYRPGSFNLVRYDLVIDPREAARRMKKVHPNAKILMVIREQVDWFSSLRKATISSLPPNQRTFNDYWTCPQGIAMRCAGFHDRVIEAWCKQFADVLILRYEDLMAPRTAQRLCSWLGVQYVAFPPQRINESHAGLAKVHQRLGFLSRLPHPVKSALKPLTRLIPGKRRPVLADHERIMIEAQYAESNRRTHELLMRQAHREILV